MISIQLKKRLASTVGEIHLDVDMSIEKGEVVGLYGASGAGKTSILRMIAGLLRPDEGRVVVENDTWFDSAGRINRATQQRNAGIVFQDYALFPNMTVRENIAFALPLNADSSGVDEMIQLMELKNLEHIRPDRLSGGQRQRVALARAIIRRPTLLLLDEPLAALDSALRMRMQDFILKVHREFGLTTLLISHDLFEVVRLCDRVFTLEHGRIKESGKPKEIVPLAHFEKLIEEIKRKYNASL